MPMKVVYQRPDDERVVPAVWDDADTWWTSLGEYTSRLALVGALAANTLAGQIQAQGTAYGAGDELVPPACWDNSDGWWGEVGERESNVPLGYTTQQQARAVQITAQYPVEDEYPGWKYAIHVDDEIDFRVYVPTPEPYRGPVVSEDEYGGWLYAIHVDDELDFKLFVPVVPPYYGPVVVEDDVPGTITIVEDDAFFSANPYPMPYVPPVVGEDEFPGTVPSVVDDEGVWPLPWMVLPSGVWVPAPVWGTDEDGLPIKPAGVPFDVWAPDRYYAPRGPHHSVPAWVSPVQVAHERRMDRIHQQQAEDMALVLAALAASEVI